MNVQMIILVVALALGGITGVKALADRLDSRWSCAGEQIGSLTGPAPCGDPAASANLPAAGSAGAPGGPGAPSGAGAPGDPGAGSQPAGEDPEGPALAGAGPLVVLPFPGSVAVSCTAVRKQEANCQGRAGVRVQAIGEVSVERSQTKLDPRSGGCPLQDLSVSARLQVELSATFEGKQVGGSLAAFTGGVRRFGVRVSPDQADAIARGDRPPPNPVDPTSLLPGESVELSQEFFEGQRLQGTFRQLQLELGFEEGRKLSVGVKRVDANTVRVSVGDTDAVRRSLALGVGEGDVSLALSGGQELSKTTVRSVEIDISTPEGFAAYQEFLATGKLPPPNSPGTRNAATTESVDFGDSTRLEASFKQVRVGGVLGDAEGFATETRRADGGVIMVIGARKNDVGFGIKESRAADGSTETTFTLLIEGADRDKIDSFERATGRSLGADPDGNIRLNFTEADLEAIRQQAIDQLHKAAQQRGIDLSRAELERLLREDPDKLRRAGLGTHPAFEIAAAESPADVLRQLALFGGPQGDPNRAVDNLLAFTAGTALARNGRGKLPRDNPDSLLPGTPDPVQCP
jgi:hypothetical protein